MISNNLLKNIPLDKSEEIFETLLDKEFIKIERIISHGEVTPLQEWYKQKDDEFVLLLSGDAIIQYKDDTKVELKPGDYLYIPALKEHRVAYTNKDETTIWLAIFFKSGSKKISFKNEHLQSKENQ